MAQVINILRSDVDWWSIVVLIVLEEGAKAQFLCDHAADDRNFLCNTGDRSLVGDNANLELNCMEETHAKNVRVSNVYIEQQRTTSKS